jgi:alcohol dehydrogenase YqhD (iron-dependent ADH family)
MNNFEFYNPTRILFGPNQLDAVGKKTAEYGKKALLVTTRSSVKKLGIFDRVKNFLEQEGIAVYELSGVDPNPRLSTVYEGAEICRKEDIDVVVALGGGSVIDCAKGIAFATFADGDLWDFFVGKRSAQKALPLIAVLTISGTGSEMNTNCVITNEALGQKYASHFAVSFPKVAIIDPNLHRTVPSYLTACGMTDTISHVLEKYFDGTENTPMQDRIAEGVTLTVIENEDVLKQPDNITMRANLSWAATMALNGLNDVGRGRKHYDAHTIELEVSAKYDIAHGAGLAIIQPSWLKALCRKSPGKFVQFAKRVFEIETSGKTDVEVGLMGIQALKNKFIEWGMPGTLKAAGIPKEDIALLANSAVNSPEGSYLNEKEVYNVLEDCYE